MNEKCNTCPRKCNINRKVQNGFCNEKNTIRIAKVIKNFMWEEPCLTADKGVLAIFFSGCNLRCDYCQNFQISRGMVGEEYSIEEFVKLIDENQENHSCIDLITPTHFSNEIAQAFKLIQKKIPIVWNTNGYETIENVEKVGKFVDIYLTDFKYSSNETAKKYSKCEQYVENCLSATKKMCDQKPDIFENDQMKQGVIIRHLVLPGEIENSLKTLDILKQNFDGRQISLMSQFTPNGKSSLNRKLTPIEYKIVLKHLENLGLSNGYVQEFSSADSCFVPKF